MARFIDEYLPSRVVGYPVDVGPMFATQITQVDSGAEQANSRWLHPLRQISIPSGVRDADTFNDVLAHWLIMRGPAKTFPWRDPTDFASVPLTKVNHAPTLSRLDQLIGTGNGVTTTFQLTKTYTVGAQTYTRNIHFPVASSVLVAVNGVDPATLSPAISWTVSRPGGVITFGSPPGVGDVIRAGFLFDLNVRYDDDETFRGIMRTFGVNGFADIPLQEVRYCED